MAGFVYMMANRRDGILYIGVTSDLARRVYEHRSGAIDGFTKRYALKRLVWFEQHDDIRSAIQRERTMKHWPRAWKARLVNDENREWHDLYPALI
jgi:putative endonuclease